jgi:hypothetical protein
MQIIRAEFSKDCSGMWILPALGYSNVQGNKSIWVGWLYWIWKVDYD